MKSTMIRAFVIAFALTGTVSAAHTETAVLGVGAADAADSPYAICPDGCEMFTVADDKPKPPPTPPKGGSGPVLNPRGAD